MATEAETPELYAGYLTKSYHNYLKFSTSKESQFQFYDNVLPAEFKRIGAGQSQVDVLGVGSGGGANDVQILTLLQSTLPDVSISVDIEEPSSDLREEFNELLSNNEPLKKIPFVWHSMTCEDYAKEVKAKEDMKKFDFIHMVQMLYYVEDLTETIKFFHSLLKENGKLLIVQCKADSGWDILWRTYKQELSNSIRPNRITSGDVVSHLKSLGLKYEEHPIATTCDITHCFKEDDEIGELLLYFITEQERFRKSLTPELRAEILDHLRNKCSIEKDGKIMFNSDACGIIVHA
ncbi:histamine N-methyltransferase-like [Genypterus blacodes]|uniref:histamine N-methyltransferase-like n=1 Tax=Genypterus blacodes TaxID=154954 RepID=UPI003F7752D4